MESAAGRAPYEWENGDFDIREGIGELKLRQKGKKFWTTMTLKQFEQFPVYFKLTAKGDDKIDQAMMESEIRVCEGKDCEGEGE